MKHTTILAMAAIASLLGTNAQADVSLLAAELTAKPADKPGGGGGGAGGGGGGGEPQFSATYYDWMSPGMESAWNQATDANGNITGYFGQGAQITVVDDFSSRQRLRADLGDGGQRLRHGEWTLKEASMIAPGANMVNFNFDNSVLPLSETDFNVINLSFNDNEALGGSNPLAVMYTSIIGAASEGTAVITKSAGNSFGAPVGTVGSGSDYLSLGLIDTLNDSGYNRTTFDSTIFVGAIDLNVVGDANVTSSGMAAYSSVAGSDPNVQRQFLVVGVEALAGENSFGTGLSGTSFAAPIVAGYAAVLHSKFTDVSPKVVAGRLLETARIDSFGSNYNVTIHGQGEADIAFAIAPDCIGPACP